MSFTLNSLTANNIYDKINYLNTPYRKSISIHMLFQTIELKGWLSGSEKTLQVPMLQCFLAGSHEEACCSYEKLCCSDSRTIEYKYTTEI